MRRLRANHIRSLYQRLLLTGSRRGEPLAAKTIVNLHQILRSALRDAVDRGLLAVSPVAGVQPPDPRSHLSASRRAKSWTAAELGALASSAGRGAAVADGGNTIPSAPASVACGWVVVKVTVSFLPKRSASADQANRVTPLFLQSPSSAETDAHDEVFTVEEAAAILRISRNAAYALARQWRATGGRVGLPCLELGRSVRVPRAALRQILEGAAPPDDDPGHRAA